MYITAYTGVTDAFFPCFKDLFGRDLHKDLPRFARYSSNTNLTIAASPEEISNTIDKILTIPNALLPALSTRNELLGYNRLIKLQLLLGYEPKVQPIPFDTSEPSKGGIYTDASKGAEGAIPETTKLSCVLQ